MNPIHIFRCSKCGCLYAFREGEGPLVRLPVSRCCPADGRLQHIPEFCFPGLLPSGDPDEWLSDSFKISSESTGGAQAMVVKS